MQDSYKASAMLQRHASCQVIVPFGNFSNCRTSLYKVLSHVRIKKEMDF